MNIGISIYLKADTMSTQTHPHPLDAYLTSRFTPSAPQWASDYEWPELSPPLIAGMLDHGDQAALLGPPGMSKSALAVSVAVALATRHPWFGKPVHPRTGRTLYLVGEGKRHYIQARLLAASAGDPDVLSHVAVWHDNGLDFGDPTVNYLPAINMAEFDLVIVDTQFRHADGDLVGGKDSMAWWRGITAMQRDHTALYGTTPAVLVVAHMAKDGPTKSVYGSVAHTGAIDTSIRVEATDGVTEDGVPKNGKVTVVPGKGRDFDPNDPQRSPFVVQSTPQVVTTPRGDIDTFALRMVSLPTAIEQSARLFRDAHTALGPSYSSRALAEYASNYLDYNGPSWSKSRVRDRLEELADYGLVATDGTKYRPTMWEGPDGHIMPGGTDND